MTEKGSHDQIDELLDLLDDKKAELQRMNAEGRPAWGDLEKHRLTQDIKDTEARLKDLGVDLNPMFPKQHADQNLLRDLHKIAHGQGESTRSNNQDKEEE